MEFNQLVMQHKESFYSDLAKVMQVKSVKGTPEKNAPFGKGPKEALETVLTLASEYGFDVTMVNDAVGYAQWGEDEKYIGVIGHLDVVPEGDGWSVPPFDLTKIDGRFYGRGVLDNKGPIMACLYGLKLLKDQGLQPKHTIRILFGTDEENGSADIPLYLKEEQPPVFGFTPDCKYPVVYGERGIVNYDIVTTFPEEELVGMEKIIGDQARDHVPDQLSLTVAGETLQVTGKRAPSNAPELGDNAIPLLAERLKNHSAFSASLKDYFTWITDHFSQNHFGEGLGIEFSDPDSGRLILTPYEWQRKGNQMVLSIAIRYPVTYSEEQVTDGLSEHLFTGSELKVVRRIKSSFFDKEDRHIQSLSRAYDEVTGEDSTPVTTTGATYARFMPNTVAFGPSFPGQKGIAHNKDEYMDESDLLSNMEIYMHAMWNLIKE